MDNNFRRYVFLSRIGTDGWRNFFQHLKEKWRWLHTRSTRFSSCCCCRINRIWVSLSSFFTLSPRRLNVSKIGQKPFETVHYLLPVFSSENKIKKFDFSSFLSKISMKWNQSHHPVNWDHWFLIRLINSVKTDEGSLTLCQDFWRLPDSLKTHSGSVRLDRFKFFNSSLGLGSNLSRLSSLIQILLNSTALRLGMFY